MLTRGSPSPCRLARGADELPARLPRALVRDVEGHVEKGQCLELARPDQRTDVDRAESDGADELEDRRLGGRIVAGHEAVELEPVGRRVHLVTGEHGVERLDDRAVRENLGELLGVGGRRVDVGAGLAERDAIRDIDHGLPAAGSAISWAMDSRSSNETARMTTSASADGLRRCCRRRAAPVAAATSAASCGSSEAMMTSWPARPSEVARAVPTLPAPMMATFIAVPPMAPGVRLDALVADATISLCYAHVNSSLLEGKPMDATPSGSPDPKPRLEVGSEIRRWRAVRGLTLAQVASLSGVNVGYLSQIENDKASPSLAVLAAIADALDVPAAWFLMGDVAPPAVVRAGDRPAVETELGRVEHVDGRGVARRPILEAIAPPGRPTWPARPRGRRAPCRAPRPLAADPGRAVGRARTGRLPALGRVGPTRGRGHRRRGGVGAHRSHPTARLTRDVPSGVTDAP